jgi:hypothetical protein
MVQPLPDRSEVEAPIRNALALLVARGTASFAVAVVALIPLGIALDGPIATLGHALLPALLVLVVVARVLHVLFVRDRADASGVWTRAYAAEPGETALAVVTAVAVPVAWLVGGSAILLRHVADPPPTPGAIAALFAPGFLVLWAFATIAWAGDCRERVALGLAESERRFREYWERVRTVGQTRS